MLVYIRGGVKNLFTQGPMRLAAAGNAEILDVLRNPSGPHGNTLAPTLLVYADLMMTGTPETSKRRKCFMTNILTR